MEAALQNEKRCTGCCRDLLLYDTRVAAPVFPALQRVAAITGRLRR
jgi:hypothetical protein